MSVKDYNKIISVVDCLTGDIILQIDYTMFSTVTLSTMISDIFQDYVLR